MSMLSGAALTAKGSSAGVFGPRVSNTALLENGDPREVVRGPPPLPRSYPSSRHRANMQTQWGKMPDYLKHDTCCPDFLFYSFYLVWAVKTLINYKENLHVNFHINYFHFFCTQFSRIFIYNRFFSTSAGEK